MKYLVNSLAVCLFFFTAISGVFTIQPVLAVPLNDFLIEQGWNTNNEQDTNYFFPVPNHYPHLHLRVHGNTVQVDELEDIRPFIDYLGLTFGDPHRENIMILGEQDELRNQLENFLNQEIFQYAQDDIALEVAENMQRFINNLTGLGVER
ncbi:MAG: hypothetical protein WBA41_16590 [Rivularia sp. (in: cyanobacteria)]